LILFIGFSFGAEGMSIAVLQDYFDRYYDAANAIVHAGASIGIMVMPLLTQFLLQVYGWRGALLIIGGLNCHILVCGGLIRPVQSMDPDNNIESDKKRGQREFTFPNIIHILDFKLFKNVTFISLICINFGKGYFYNSWLIYLVPHSLDTGFQPYQASTIATFGGVGHLVGSLSFLLVVQKLSKQKIIYLSICLASLSLGIDPLLTASHAYVGLMLTSFTLNMGMSWNACVLYSTLGGIVEEDEYCSAVNYLFAMYSMGSLASGFFTGKCDGLPFLSS
jgi:predicted MFS family arabinose efflux permease